MVSRLQYVLHECCFAAALVLTLRISIVGYVTTGKSVYPDGSHTRNPESRVTGSLLIFAISLDCTLSLGATIIADGSINPDYSMRITETLSRKKKEKKYSKFSMCEATTS
jgi:hypothetical protein